MQPIQTYAEQDFKITAGDDWILVFEYENNGVAVDITGYTFTLGIKTDESSNSDLVTTTGVLTSPSLGIVTFTILKTTLAILEGGNTYHYYITVLDNDSKTVTRVKGNLIYTFK
jgi:hypothetical protein